MKHIWSKMCDMNAIMILWKPNSSLLCCVPGEYKKVYTFGGLLNKEYAADVLN